MGIMDELENEFLEPNNLDWYSRGYEEEDWHHKTVPPEYAHLS